MNRINQFNIEPGVHKYNGQTIVVVTIVTHTYVDWLLTELAEPLVVYRDLETNINNHVCYQMSLSEFKKKGV